MPCCLKPAQRSRTSDCCGDWRSAAGQAGIALWASSPTVTTQARLLLSGDHLPLSPSHYAATGTEQAWENRTSNRPHLCQIGHLPHEMSDLRRSLFTPPAVKTTEIIGVKLTKQHGNQVDAQPPLSNHISEQRCISPLLSKT